MIFLYVSFTFRDKSKVMLGGGNGYPLQYSCLENPMDTGSWQTTVHGVVESDMAEQLTHTHTHAHTGNGIFWARLNGNLLTLHFLSVLATSLGSLLFISALGRPESFPCFQSASTSSSQVALSSISCLLQDFHLSYQNCSVFSPIPLGYYFLLT